MTRQSVIKGAFILSAAGFGVRFIGLGFKSSFECLYWG